MNNVSRKIQVVIKRTPRFSAETNTYRLFFLLEPWQSYVHYFLLAHLKPFFVLQIIFQKRMTQILNLIFLDFHFHF